MGYKPGSCIILEDSLPGLTAALKTGMLTVAYLGCNINNSSEYKKKVSDLGVKYLFDKMEDVKSFLLSPVVRV